jgi:hypothetical protein
MTKGARASSSDQALLSTLSAILQKLHGVEEIGPGRWRACCPRHDDRKPSLYITLENDRILLHDFGGCKTEDIVRALGLRMADLFSKNSRQKKRIYAIRDLDGNIVAEHVRIDKPKGKKMWWQRNGEEGLNGLSSKDLPLYGAEKLREIPRGTTLVLAEGEKATEALWNAGICAVGTVCGASNTPSPKVLECLKDYKIVLWPDNDAPGKEHMEQIGRTLLSMGAREIRWVVWEGAPEGGDAADADPETIRRLVETAEPWPHPVSFREYREEVRKWVYLENWTPLEVVLSGYIANFLPGDPLWLMIVGPPGSLKTELLNLLSGLPSVCVVDTLTPNTFLSGKERKEPKASLLRRFGEGILIIKDFSLVLSLNREARAEIFSQLRRIYDGELAKATGEGGQSAYIEWKGKIGVIAACTPAIERHWSFNGALGERFLYYRMPELSREQATLKALENQHKLGEMRKSLKEETRNLISNVSIPQIVPVSIEFKSKLVVLAEFVAVARAPVERDDRTREVIDIPDPEVPTRLAQQLLQIACGHAVLMGREEVTDEDWPFVVQCAIGCIPQRRLLLLTKLSRVSEPQSVKALAEALGLPTKTIERDLEDLSLVGIELVQKTKTNRSVGLWELSGKARRGLELIYSANWVEEDPSTWPVCSGCERKVPRVNSRGFCPDCAAVLEGGDK